MKSSTSRSRRGIRFLAASLLIATATPALRAQLLFEFSYTPAVTALPGPTLTGITSAMTAAGAKWSSILTDPITLKITVDLDPTLPSSAFAAAYTTKVATTYLSVAGALGTDAISATDFSAVGSLQSSPKIEAITQDTTDLIPPSAEIRLGGATSGIWNSTLSVSRANLKALGIISGTDGSAGAEGTLAINPTSIALFDFTRFVPPGPPIDPGKFDFTGIAIHELGHLMGFYSGVDEVDYVGDGANLAADHDLTDDAIFSVLDLYRYSPASLAAPSQPSTGAVNDWRYGPPAPPISFLPKPYFSVDAGITPIAAFATGAVNGDGDQASHYADGVAAIMDPGFGAGVLADPTAIDIVAMDAIGWNIVPEPGAALLLIGTLALAALRRRRA